MKFNYIFENNGTQKIRAQMEKMCIRIKRMAATFVKEKFHMCFFYTPNFMHSYSSDDVGIQMHNRPCLSTAVPILELKADGSEKRATEIEIERQGKKKNNIRNLYIDSDSTGENLRLITTRQQEYRITERVAGNE